MSKKITKWPDRPSDNPKVKKLCKAIGIELAIFKLEERLEDGDTIQQAKKDLLRSAIKEGFDWYRNEGSHAVEGIEWQYYSALKKLRV